MTFDLADALFVVAMGLFVAAFIKGVNVANGVYESLPKATREGWFLFWASVATGAISMGMMP